MHRHSLEYYKRKLFRFYRPFKLIFILIFIGFWLVLAGLFIKLIFTRLSNSLSQPAQLINILFDKNINLESQQNRVNLLLLGIGGENHTAGQLTDTIILVSLSAIGQPTVIVSLPRDLWVNSMQAKLNTAYYYGEQKTPGGGLILSRSAIKELTGVPVNYVFVLDFKLFERIIDFLGGITVDVGQSFTDKRYPIEGLENAEPESSRYETISFTAGPTHMDGATALKYVRSRHASGDNGTDFDRSRRQQEVISAIKSQLLSSWSLTHPRSIWRLKNLILQSLITDLPSTKQPDLIKLLLAARKNTVIKTQLQTGNENQPSLLYSPKNFTDNQWVLLPLNDDPTLLPAYFSCLLNTSGSPQACFSSASSTQ